MTRIQEIVITPPVVAMSFLEGLKSGVMSLLRFLSQSRMSIYPEKFFFTNLIVLIWLTLSKCYIRGSLRLWLKGPKITKNGKTIPEKTIVLHRETHSVPYKLCQRNPGLSKWSIMCPYSREHKAAPNFTLSPTVCSSQPPLLSNLIHPPCSTYAITNFCTTPNFCVTLKLSPILPVP